MKTSRSLLLLAALPLFGQPDAMSPEEKGRWVAQQIDAREEGFVNQVSETTMILRNKRGQESRREMTIKTLEVKEDGDKSITIFQSPKDVKGTAFLSYTHIEGPDDQWLYLPALRRVKRISSNNKSGPFMGSEFAYEDLSSQEIEKYTYTYVRSEKVMGEDGHVIERVPVDKKSGYTRQLVWVESTEWRIAKIEFYDRKNKLLKTLTFEDYKEYPNKKWRAQTFHMVNHQTGKSTELTWNDIKFGQDISERDFDQNALRRVR